MIRGKIRNQVFVGHGKTFGSSMTETGSLLNKGVIRSGLRFRRISPVAEDTRQKERKDRDCNSPGSGQWGSNGGDEIWSDSVYFEGRTSIICCWLNVGCKRIRRGEVKGDSTALSLSSWQGRVIASEGEMVME